MRSKETQEVDTILEDGLASYCLAEPRRGMEERIVRSVLAQEKPRRARWPWALGALATAALIVISLPTTSVKTAHPRRVVQTAPATHSVPQTNLSGPKEAGVRSEATPNHAIGTREGSRSGVERTVARAHRRTGNGDEMFPSPQVLSEEESRIIALVDQHPAEISQALIEAQTRSVEPVRVAAIHIEPLNKSGQQQEE